MVPFQFANRLRFPETRASLNVSHPMFMGARLACVAAPGGGFIDLLTGKASVTTGGVLTSSVTSAMGLAVNSTASTIYNAVSNSFADTATSFTMGAILRNMALVGNTTIIFGTRTILTGSAGLFLGLAGVLNVYVNGSGLTTSGNFIPTVNVPYFFVYSVRNGQQNWAALNLLTGRLYSGSSALAATMTIGTGSFAVGGLATASQYANGPIAAVAYSVNNFMSVGQLLEWAQAPWDYWYSAMRNSDLMSMAMYGTAGATGTAMQARAIVMA